MYLSNVENERLSALVSDWQKNNSIPQEAFNWTRSKPNWQKDFEKYTNFISALPDEIDRSFLRTLVSNKNVLFMEKFLAIMIWGYGDLGYGSYRVKKMFSSENVESKISHVFEICQSGNSLEAYEFLSKNRITQLGPAFGTKLISFFTPREICAPIYDSFIWKWMDVYAKEAFGGASSSSEVWSLRIYSNYLNWMKFHSAKYDCFADDLELVIFRDAMAQFSKSSPWEGQ